MTQEAKEIGQPSPRILQEQDMYVRELMTREPVTAAPGDALALAQFKMRAGGFRRLPVIHEGKLIGIVSEHDLRRCLDSLDSTVVLEAMTPDPVTVSPSATLEHAVALLKGKEIGALPVVDHGRLIGIVTASNLWFPEPRPLPEWERH
jgi:acetoin utilization protein AcuB